MTRLFLRCLCMCLPLALLTFGSGCDRKPAPPPGADAGSLAPERPDTPVVPDGEKVDDWDFKPSDFRKAKKRRSKGMAPPAPMAVASSAKIGLSAGGAKDVGNFRENIKNDFLPLPTDITYEGLFYDYKFDTGKEEECKKLFCPSYTFALSKDPISKKQEHFLSVGLNSGIEEKDFGRKKLNLVVVLDISGSMSSRFNEYYYDRFGQRRELAKEEMTNDSKMEVANKSIVAMLDHLKPDDRLGIVLFDDMSYLAKPLSLVGRTDMDMIRKHVLALRQQGGTNMEAGMREGTRLMDAVEDADRNVYENRIIFLTDAMPNTGDTSETGLMGMARANADNGIFTTFIGIGVDFNTGLIEAITKIRGANYYSVHSDSQFIKRLDEEFEFMVTPLVFDLTLALDAKGYKILKVYGSPEADEATGEIMKVNTLFPSKVEEEETRGGVILLKLQKVADDAQLALRTSYADRTGKQDGDRAEIEFPAKDKDFYQNTGVRKAVLLSRYADLMINWMMDARRVPFDKKAMPTLTRASGIVPPDHKIKKWERKSLPLQVSMHYKELFRLFKAHMTAEMGELGDESLKKEIAILTMLAQP
jgi:Ca-activated chloride channel homolog